MNINLMRSAGYSVQDNLIAKIYPPVEAVGVVIRKTEQETLLKRGTVLAVSSADRKLVILGTEEAESEVLVPAYILSDDILVDNTGDVTGVAYRSGNFNRKAVIVKDGYTLSADDEDNLREYSIVFSDMMEA